MITFNPIRIKMEIKFLGQGFEAASSDSVGHNLITLFGSGEYHTFTAVSAFLSQAGITGLGNLIKQDGNKFKDVTVITGVDQQGTSKEALEALLALNINSYVFYQPGISIFHPKIYLFEGDLKSTVIIGSSNLTTQGLFVNVEASLRLEIKHDDADGMAILKQITDYYDGLYNLSDPNLSPLSDTLIQTLVAANIVPTEPERRRLYSKSEGAAASRTSVTGVFPRRALPTAPAAFKSTRASNSASSTGTGTAPTGTAVSNAQTVVAAVTTPTAATQPTTGAQLGNLVWVRRSLPASSVQQFAAGTNPTGGLRLVQDRFFASGAVIDQTTYFRNVVFGGYAWAQVSLTPFVEVAVVPFEITIRGVNVGTFNLSIRHKPSGDAGQNNYTTSISWGNAVAHITAQDLTGSRLELYSPVVAGSPFEIVIS